MRYGSWQHPTTLDRLKNALYTALTNRGGTLVTKQEHDQQRARVIAAERLSLDLTERRNSYARRPTVIRHTVSGWRHGNTTPPRPTGRES